MSCTLDNALFTQRALLTSWNKGCEIWVLNTEGSVGDGHTSLDCKYHCLAFHISCKSRKKIMHLIFIIIFYLTNIPSRDGKTCKEPEVNV